AVADFNACRCKRRDRAKRHTCSELGCQRQREQRSGRRPIDAGRTAGINGRGSVRPEVRARRWVVGVNHDPGDEIINHSGDAVDSAEPVVQGGSVLHSHRCSFGFSRLQDSLPAGTIWRKVELKGSSMDIIPLGPGFAVELRGVTIAEIASDAAKYSAVRAAFEDHSVLIFRSQRVDDESQLIFSRCFGPPEVTKVGSQGTGTHFVILSTIGEDGKVVPVDHRLAQRNRANQLWHTDSSFKKIPALTSVLSARIIPARGGET